MGQRTSYHYNICPEGQIMSFNTLLIHQDAVDKSRSLSSGGDNAIIVVNHLAGRYIRNTKRVHSFCVNLFKHIFFTDWQQNCEHNSRIHCDNLLDRN